MKLAEVLQSQEDIIVITVVFFTYVQGDAGAPLLCQKHGLYFLFGLISWGSRQCDQKPAVFSKISVYNSWINSIIEI